jgi:hypothetical protein
MRKFRVRTSVREMEDHLPFSLDKESLKGALHQSKSGLGERQ